MGRLGLCGRERKILVGPRGFTTVPGRATQTRPRSWCPTVMAVQKRAAIRSRWRVAACRSRPCRHPLSYVYSSAPSPGTPPRTGLPTPRPPPGRHDMVRVNLEHPRSRERAPSLLLTALSHSSRVRSSGRTAASTVANARNRFIGPARRSWPARRTAQRRRRRVTDWCPHGPTTDSRPTEHVSPW